MGRKGEIAKIEYTGICCLPKFIKKENEQSARVIELDNVSFISNYMEMFTPVHNFTS